MVCKILPSLFSTLAEHWGHFANSGVHAPSIVQVS